MQSGVADQRIPRACWLAIPANWWVLGVVREPVSKNNIESNWGRRLMSASAPHMTTRMTQACLQTHSIHPSTLTHTYTVHTDTHTETHTVHTVILTHSHKHILSNKWEFSNDYSFCWNSIIISDYIPYAWKPSTCFVPNIWLISFGIMLHILLK